MLFRKKKEEEKIPTVHDQKMLDYSSELYKKTNAYRVLLRQSQTILDADEIVSRRQ